MVMSDAETPNKIKQKKRGMHLLTRMVLFFILVSFVPLVTGALSLNLFDTWHQSDIDARQFDIIVRVGNDLDKEFSSNKSSSSTLKERLSKVIAESANARTGYIYITDDRGVLLAHSEKEVPDNLNLSASPIVGGKLFPGTIRTEGQTRYESFWGEPVVGSGAIKSVVGLGQKLGIFVELSSVDADKLFVQLTQQFILFTLLAVILTAILSFYLTSKILTPIRALQSGTKRVSEEKFDEPVQVTSGDEIEDLGEAFNTMMSGLKELKELREEFVFVAAHELRTPVTAIKGFIQLVLEDKTAEVKGTNKEYLTKAIAANERLIQLVNDLLEVAREEEGRLEIQFVPTTV